VHYANILEGGELRDLLTKKNARKKHFELFLFYNFLPYNSCVKFFCLLPDYPLLPPPSCVMAKVANLTADFLRGGKRIKQVK
jgi:hypothetical protein